MVKPTRRNGMAWWAGVSAAALGLLLAGVGPLGAHGGDAALIHGCVQKSSGQLRIVAPSERCAASETAVDWNQQGPPGPPGPAGADGGAGGLQVVDARGDVVGSVVSMSGLNPVVGIASGGTAFLLNLMGGQLQGHAGVFFDGPGCSGATYAQRVTTALPFTGVDHLGRIFVDDGQGAPASVAVQSVGSPSGCVDMAFSFPLVPSVQVFDLGVFTPPFSVQ